MTKSDKLKNFFLLYDPRNRNPWRRFFARILDIHIGSMILMIMLNIALPIISSIVNKPIAPLFSNTLYYIMFFLFVWVGIEAFLLRYFSTTPGKWLLGIKIKDSKGASLTLSVSFKRSFLVWSQGIAIGIPIINLITMYIARNQLVNDRNVSWDKECNTDVQFTKMGFVRTTMLILTTIVLVTLHYVSGE